MKSLRLALMGMCLFLYSFSAFTKTLVISDIDDTIKKANSMGGIGGVWHFLRKKPYEEARDLFNEIKNNEIKMGETVAYYYVSAAPSYTFDGDEWIFENNFPTGPVFLKTKNNGGNTYDYKTRTIKNIIEAERKKDPRLKILFFGDNSQYDAQVYYDLRIAMNLDAKIYIRDVSTEATYFDTSLPVKKLDNVVYFFSERELVDHPDFLYMSSQLRNKIIFAYEKEDLIPGYTLDTLKDRLQAMCKRADLASCKDQAKADAKKYWQDYYHRF